MEFSLASCETWFNPANKLTCSLLAPGEGGSGTWALGQRAVPLGELTERRADGGTGQLRAN